MKKIPVLIALFSLANSTSQGAIGLTFTDGSNDTTAQAYLGGGVSKILYAAPMANQPSWGQPISGNPNDPGPFHDVEIDFSSNVAGEMDITPSPGTSNGRITFKIDEAFTGAINFKFLFNYELTSIPGSELNTSNTASAIRMRQVTDIGFDYGIDVELLNSTSTLKQMFSNTSPNTNPSSSDWWNPSTGSDWNAVNSSGGSGGSHISIDGLTSGNDNKLEMTMLANQGGPVGFEIVDQSRGDGTLAWKGWEFTVDSGSNTFAAGTEWTFTFDGARRLADRQIPEPTSTVMLGLVGMMFLARRKRP